MRKLFFAKNEGFTVKDVGLFVECAVKKVALRPADSRRCLRKSVVSAQPFSHQLMIIVQLLKQFGKHALGRDLQGHANGESCEHAHEEQ
jgi:hypothetical protein